MREYPKELYKNPHPHPHADTITLKSLNIINVYHCIWQNYCIENYVLTCVRISGKKFVGHLKFPWDRASAKNLFYNEYNQFEKIPQNDDSTSDNQNEYA